MRTPLFALLPLVLMLGPFQGRALGVDSAACPPATGEEPLILEPSIPVPAPPVGASGPSGPPPSAASASMDYRHRLRPTPLGWARLESWCLWVEPPRASGPAALWEGRWYRAVQAALVTWARLLPITLVDDPGRAQILVERRRPPRLEINGRWRASHGRALIRLRLVERDRQWRPEPQVSVLIGAGQAEPALQATALHELGHAFGLWGHSDRVGDVMAAVPGPTPLLVLSERDLGTLRWLYQQPTRFGRLEPSPPSGSRQ